MSNTRNKQKENACSLFGFLPKNIQLKIIHEFVGLDILNISAPNKEWQEIMRDRLTFIERLEKEFDYKIPSPIKNKNAAVEIYHRLYLLQTHHPTLLNLYQKTILITTPDFPPLYASKLSDLDVSKSTRLFYFNACLYFCNTELMLWLLEKAPENRRVQPTIDLQQALERAVSMGKLNFAYTLLTFALTYPEKLPTINIHIDLDWTFRVLLIEGHIEFAEKLINDTHITQNERVKFSNEYLIGPLAIEKNYYSFLDKFLSVAKNKVSPARFSCQSANALHTAAFHGNVNIFHLLIKKYGLSPTESTIASMIDGGHIQLASQTMQEWKIKPNVGIIVKALEKADFDLSKQMVTQLQLPYPHKQHKIKKNIKYKEIIYAINNNHIDRLQQILGIDQYSGWEHSLLLTAVQAPHNALNILTSLLKNTPYPLYTYLNILKKHFKSLIEAAITSNHLEVLKYLLTYKSISKIDENDRLDLWKAATSSGHLEIFQYLIECYLIETANDIHKTELTEEIKSHLVIAAFQDGNAHHNIVEYLIESAPEKIKITPSVQLINKLIEEDNIWARNNELVMWLTHPDRGEHRVILDIASFQHAYMFQNNSCQYKYIFLFKQALEDLPQKVIFLEWLKHTEDNINKLIQLACLEEISDLSLIKQLMQDPDCYACLPARWAPREQNGILNLAFKEKDIPFLKWLLASGGKEILRFQLNSKRRYEIAFKFVDLGEIMMAKEIIKPVLNISIEEINFDSFKDLIWALENNTHFRNPSQRHTLMITINKLAYNLNVSEQAYQDAGIIPDYACPTEFLLDRMTHYIKGMLHDKNEAEEEEEEEHKSSVPICKM